jgi:hypothetical protein
MKLSLSLKIILVITGLACGSVLLIWAFAKGFKELAKGNHPKSPIEAPSLVSPQKGERLITLDQAGQLKSGIVIAPLSTS